MKIPVFGFNRIGLVTNAFFILVIALSAVFVSAQKVASPQPENASADHCHNGPISGPVLPCSFVNGNSHGGNSQWYENEFIAYRVVNSDFAAGTTGATMTIDYDTTVGNTGKHAIDYLGWYNYSQTNGVIPGTNTADAVNYPNEGNNPCQPATCPGAPLFVPFPVDPNVTAGQDGILGNADDIVQIPGGLTVWGATNVSISPTYTLSGDYSGASNTLLTVTFDVGATGVVYFAWGGHIASRLDWGALNSAVAISGSPYHMSVDGGADRQLKVETRGFPAILTIIKQVQSVITGGISNQLFTFTRTGQPNFTLQDNNVNNDGFSDRVTFSYPLNPNQTASATITELVAGNGWSVSDIDCVDSSGGLGSTANSTPQPDGPNAWVGGNTAVANMQEAEFVTCTFFNAQAAPTAAPANLSGRVVNSAGRGISGLNMELVDLSTGQSRVARTNTFGYYMFEEVETTLFYSLSVNSKRYTFSEPTRYFTLNEDTFDMNFYSSN